MAKGTDPYETSPLGVVDLKSILFTYHRHFYLNIYGKYDRREWLHFLMGEITLSKLFCLPSKKGSTLKGKKLSKFFPFRVDPFQNGLGVKEIGIRL